MISNPKTKSEEHNKVEAKTPADPDNPDNGELTTEELAALTGGDGGESIFTGVPQGLHLARDG